MNKLAWTLAFLAVTTTALADATFKDNDEGSMGPLQDKHEGGIIFSGAKIKRDETSEAKLVTEATLLKPLFARVYQAKTPARVLHENGQTCLASNRRIRWHAQLEGQKNGVWLRTSTADDDLWTSMRSASLTDLDGEVISLVPTKRVTFPDPNGDSHPAFIELVAAMKVGRNVVNIEVENGCLGTKGKNGREWVVVSKGQIAFNVKAGDIQAFTKLVGPDVERDDPAAEARIKSLFAKTLVPGAKLLAFGASKTDVQANTKKDTKVRSILKNADKTCSYQSGHWIETYKGGGLYDSGRYDTVSDPTPVPCP